MKNDLMDYQKRRIWTKNKLSEKQFEQLKENIIKKQLTSVREVKHEIINEFDVVYSDRQIRRIMKKLCFGYGKPHIIPVEAPENASEQLKKHRRNRFKKKTY